MYRIHFLKGDCCCHIDLECTVAFLCDQWKIKTFESKFSTFSTLSSSTFDSNTISFYPNPTTNLVSISGLTNNGNVQLFSVLGIKVLEQNIENNASLDVSNLSSGVYLVKIVSDYKSFETKLIIK